MVLRDSRRVGVFAANRHETVGPATDREVAILRLLAPHIRRAVTIGDLLDLRKVEAQALGSTLEHLAAGVIVVGDGNRILHANGVFLIPDILANAGGVTVSYFEWVQGLQSFLWKEAEVNAKLRDIMVRAFGEVLSHAETLGVDMRMGAYVLAVAKVVQALDVRGIYP